jgi:hypothetical protein
MTKCGQRIKFRWHCQVMQKAVTKNTVEQKIATQISTTNLGKPYRIVTSSLICVANTKTILRKMQYMNNKRKRTLTIMNYHHFRRSTYHTEGLNPAPAIIALLSLPAHI